MVNNKTIDAKILSRMFLAGAKNLEAKKEWINELNVFPVPDGDTGTNMTLTIMSAASEVGALENPDMETLAKAISSGSLRGARGNSGVILSQLLRGFTRGVRKLTDLDAPAIAAAMESAIALIPVFFEYLLRFLFMVLLLFLNSCRFSPPPILPVPQIKNSLLSAKSFSCSSFHHPFNTEML